MAESFIQLGLLLTIAAWLACRDRWRGVWLFVPMGITGGLAVLSKLNGGLILMTMAVLAAWTWIWSGWSLASKIRVSCGALAAGLCSFLAFAALNPFVTTRPSLSAARSLGVVAPPEESLWTRTGRIIAHRADVSRNASEQFPHNALRNPGSKLLTSLVQGFGRFGPFGHAHTDSTQWLDPRQDWGAALWLPCVVGGAIVAWRRGRESAAARAVWLHAAVACLTVTLFLPLAWDRYLMSIQPPACLLGAAFLDAVWRRLTRSASEPLSPSPQES